MIKYLELALSQEVYEYLEELDEIRCLCDVTLSVYLPGHSGIWTYDLWNTSPNANALSTELCGQVGLNPNVAWHIFQACPVWICTQSNITQASYSQISWLLDYTDIEGTRLSSEISHTRTAPTV